MQEITPKRLKEMLDAKHELLLIDVRQPWEFKVCHISGSKNIPLGELDQNFDQLPNEVDIVTICHHGMRSKQAAHLLQSCGYDRVINLQGGVDTWAQEIEPTMERY